MRCAEIAVGESDLRRILWANCLLEIAIGEVCEKYAVPCGIKND